MLSRRRSIWPSNENSSTVASEVLHCAALRSEPVLSEVEGMTNAANTLLLCLRTRSHGARDSDFARPFELAGVLRDGYGVTMGFASLVGWATRCPCRIRANTSLEEAAWASQLPILPLMPTPGVLRSLVAVPGTLCPIATRCRRTGAMFGPFREATVPPRKEKFLRLSPCSPACVRLPYNKIWRIA